jgi:hypothetical protein
MRVLILAEDFVKDQLVLQPIIQAMMKEIGTPKAKVKVEVWLLVGHDLPRKWNWRTIRAEVHPKERYYQPFAESRGVLDLPDEGRDKLAREPASRYDRIRRRCKEDIQRLEGRIRDWIGDRK